MDTVQMKAARKILGLIAENDGLFSWYNIEIQMGIIGEVNPPPYYVLEELAKLGYLRIDPAKSTNQPKYWITEAGQAFLNSNSDMLPAERA